AAVDGHRLPGLALGAVDRGVRGGVDDHVRAQAAHRRSQHLGLAQVAAVVVGTPAAAVEGGELSERRQRPLKLPADLAVASQQHDSHGAAPSTKRAAIDSRYAPLSTSDTQSGWSRYQRTVLRRPLAKVSTGRQPSSRPIRRASIAYRRSWPGRSGTNVISRR